MKSQKNHKSLIDTHLVSQKQPFSTHLRELRSRIFWILLCLFIGSLIGYYLHSTLLEILLKPLNQPVFYNSPTGGLDLIFKVCIFFGFIFTIPIFTYHLFRFIEPIFPKHSKFVIIWFLTGSFSLAIIGISFAYLISLPVILKFFNSFGTTQVQPLISTDEYFSFVTYYLAGFGFLFQLPVILLLFNQIKPLKLNWLFTQEKYVIVISFLLGAIFAPDPIDQFILALPLIFLYQISILIIWFINKNAKK